MTRSDDLDRTLKTWFNAEAAGPEPAAILATVLDATRTRVPRPGWFVRLRGSGIGAGRRTRPWTVARPILLMLLLGLLLVVAIGAAVLVGGQPSAPDLPPAVTGPTLGREIPVGATSGSIQTPIGTARWVHLTGDPSSLPLTAPFAEGSMFVALEQVSDDEGNQLGRRRWTSSDGLRWTSEEVAIPIGDSFARFRVDGADTWAMSYGPGSLWRSSGQGPWVAIDQAGIVPAGPPELDWDVEFQNIVSADGLTAVELTLTAQPPFEGWPGDPSRVTEVEPGLFSIRPRSPEGEPRSLRFEETQGGLRVIDDTDGSELALLDGFTLAVARDWVLDGLPVEHLVARVDGDRLVPTADGGLVLGDPEVVPRLAMLGTPAGVVAMVQSDPAGPAVAWSLDAGGNWTELGPWDITVPDGGGTFYIGDTNQDLNSDLATNELYALYDGPGTSTRRSWRSSDGLHWEQALDSHPLGMPMALPSGYLELQWVPEPRVWWASPDGSTWEPLDLSPMGLTPDLWGSPEVGDSQFGLRVVGQAAFIVLDDRVTGRHMWVLDFDTPPQ